MLQILAHLYFLPLSIGRDIACCVTINLKAIMKYHLIGRSIAGCAMALLFSFAVTAQDLDYPDFRQKRDNFSKMAEKDIKAEVAAFSMAGIEESINKKPLEKLPLKDIGGNYVKYENDHIQVYIKTGVFFPTKHKITSMENHVVKIDGRPFYGCYGTMPKTTIDSVSVIIDKDTVVIPAVAYKDIYNPAFTFSKEGEQKTRNNVYLSPDKRRIYIYMLGMGDNGTEYTWIIQDKKYLRRVLDFGVLR